MLLKDGILRKAESPKQKEPWTITTVHTIATIRDTHKTKSERINIQRVELFFKTKNMKLETQICTNICLHS